MREKKNYEKIGETLFDLTEDVAPETREELKRELRDVGIEWKGIGAMKRDLEKLLARSKKQELREKIGKWLEVFREDLMFPQFLQLIPAFVTRSGDSTPVAEKTALAKRSYDRAKRLIRKGKYDEARSIFEDLITEDDRANISRYRYMLAHVLLGMEEIAAAVEQLESIEGEFEERARYILNELKR